MPAQDDLIDALKALDEEVGIISRFRPSELANAWKTGVGSLRELILNLPLDDSAKAKLITDLLQTFRFPLRRASALYYKAELRASEQTGPGRAKRQQNSAQIDVIIKKYAEKARKVRRSPSRLSSSVRVILRANELGRIRR
jgi:hypothetical protein